MTRLIGYSQIHMNLDLSYWIYLAAKNRSLRQAGKESDFLGCLNWAGLPINTPSQRWWAPLMIQRNASFIRGQNQHVWTAFFCCVRRPEIPCMWGLLFWVNSHKKPGCWDALGSKTHSSYHLSYTIFGYSHTNSRGSAKINKSMLSSPEVSIHSILK